MKKCNYWKCARTGSFEITSILQEWMRNSCVRIEQKKIGSFETKAFISDMERRQGKKYNYAISETRGFSIIKIKQKRGGSNMQKSKKSLIIGSVVIAVLAIAVVVAFLFIGKKANRSGYTVKFELCTELQTTTVLDRTVTPGSFLEEPEVYVTGNNEENWSISGWYTEPEYELQWDFDFDTVESDLTLYAKWEAKPECTVSFYTQESAEPVYITKVRKGLVTARCDAEFMGREVLGYYSDKSMTQVFSFDEKIEKDTDIYVEISDYVYFNAKTLAKWNVCGNQSEATKYKMATSLSTDETVYTVSSKDGGYLWLSNLSLSMNDTSIIQIKARELNDNYSGVIGGYIIGEYNVDGVLGGSSDFGQTNTGALIYSRSTKPDAEGFYTYTYNISNLTPGLIYDKLTGIRIDFYGTDTYTYEIKEVKTFVDKYSVSAAAFKTNGIDFNGLHLNTFALMGSAETEVLANGDLRLGGKDGAFIFKKDIEIALGEQQLVRLKAKGDLNGGAIALFFYGDYTLNGKSGTTKDYTSKHMVYFTPTSTDASGYTIYTADISSISGLKYNVIRGLRLDLYGEGTRTIEIQSMKSYAPSKEEVEVKNDFEAIGLNFTGAHLSQFLTYGEAKVQKLSNGNLKFSGPDSSMIYKKDMKVTLGKDQLITLKAKGDMNGGAIGLYLYGEYIKNGTSGSKEDFDAEHVWIMEAGETDAEGYTTYTADISSIAGLKYNVIRGLRLDLYGNGTRTIEIASLKSSVPKIENGSSGEEEDKDDNSFKMDGLNLTGTHLKQFQIEGGAQTEFLANGNFSFTGPDSAMIFKKDMEVTLGDDQVITLKAKGDLQGGIIGLFMYGDYTLNSVAGSKADYDAEHMWIMEAGQTDAEGYTTYTVDIGSIEGLKYNMVRGLRLDLYGNGTRTIEIESLKSSAPEIEDGGSDEEEDKDDNAFKMNGLSLTGTHLNQFQIEGGAQTELLANGDLRFGGPDSAFIYKKNTEITLGNEQLIIMKAKGDLKGGAIGVYLFGDYTMNGTPGTLEDYGPHMWIVQVGEVDKDGYTTYTIDISSILGLRYDIIRGIRIDLYSAQIIEIEIATVQSMEKSVSSNVILSPEDLEEFEPLNGASVQLNPDGTFHMEGTDGAFVHKKGLDIDVTDDQKIVMRAKVSSGAAIGIYLFGEFTKDGEPTAISDYDGNYVWIMEAGETDAEGYATYTIDLRETATGITNLQWEIIKGFRVELWGGGTLSLDIKEINAIPVS